MQLYDFIHNLETFKRSGKVFSTLFYYLCSRWLCLFMYFNSMFHIHIRLWILSRCCFATADLHCLALPNLAFRLSKNGPSTLSVYDFFALAIVTNKNNIHSKCTMPKASRSIVTFCVRDEINYLILWHRNFCKLRCDFVVVGVSPFFRFVIHSFVCRLLI